MRNREMEIIRRSYRGQAAFRHVTAISQQHRIQASPGYRAAAHYVLEQLGAADLQAEILPYPADGLTRNGAAWSFLEWACDSATLQLLDDQGRPCETLCDFDAVPISLIQRSIPADGVFDVVLPGGKGGSQPEDYEGLDVTGKLVLTNAGMAGLLERAVRERGAAGILYDGMAAGGRSELDLPDALQYTSFWWPGARQPSAFGFVVSPRRGRSLRARLAAGEQLRVRASVHTRFYPGSLDVVQALIPGVESGAEVLLVSHLCHPQPGAHDNASGAGALVELAATLQRLIASGELERPRRGIRFLWIPEFSGTYAWLAAHQSEVRSGKWIAGLNLDMVGADQAATGGSWRFVALPEAGAAFADHLLAWLRQPYLAGTRWEDHEFEAGSDHFILSDPEVGIPTPMIIQWPDKFYHTSADTLDKVSVDSLYRSGALGAEYAYWLASSGQAEASWLGHWMVRRLQAAAAARSASAIAETACVSIKSYREVSAFHAEASERALRSLCRIDESMSGQVEVLVQQFRSAAAEEDAWVEAGLGNGADGAAPEHEVDWWREAAALVPHRRFLGSAEISQLSLLEPLEIQQELWRLSSNPALSIHLVAVLAQYWTDGRRTVAEIADRVRLESQGPHDDVVLRVFKLMDKIGIIELRTAT